jgi:predicted DNA-binding protein with PD1-like motif
MLMLPLRLVPGQDLRRSLELAAHSRGCTAAFVISGIGSLSDVHLRFADATTCEAFLRPTEILTLSGTVAANGSHLHMSLATASGDRQPRGGLAFHPGFDMGLAGAKTVTPSPRHAPQHHAILH